MEGLLLRAFRFHGGDALKSLQVSWRGCSYEPSGFMEGLLLRAFRFHRGDALRGDDT